MGVLQSFPLLVALIWASAAWAHPFETYNIRPETLHGYEQYLGIFQGLEDRRSCFVGDGTLSASTPRFRVPSLEPGFKESPELKVRCGPRLEVQSFCSSARRSCERLGGSPDCWLWAQPPEGLAAEREESAELRDRIMRYTAGYFEQIKNDPEALENCCKGSEGCKDHLKATRLQFIEGMPRGDRTAYYVNQGPFANQVHISMTRAVNSLSAESLHWLLLHELGHACQHGKALGLPVATDQEFVTKAKVLDVLVGESTCAAGTGTFGMAETLGGTVSHCVQAQLHRHAREAVRDGALKEGKLCRSLWEQEAFASSVFAFKMDSVRDWAWMCFNAPDEDHPSQREYLGCLLQDRRVRRNFCGPGRVSLPST